MADENNNDAGDYVGLSPTTPFDLPDLPARSIKLETPETPFSDPDSVGYPEKRQRHMDWVGAIIAGTLLLVFAGSLLLPIVFWMYTGAPPDHAVLDYGKHASGNASTLLGAIIGFYFAKERLGFKRQE